MIKDCKVYHLIGIKGGRLLLVFHTNLRGHQFRLVTSEGVLMGERAIFYTAQAALSEGLSWVYRKKLKGFFGDRSSSLVVLESAISKSLSCYNVTCQE